MEFFRKRNWENAVLIVIVLVTVGLMAASVRFERLVGNQKLMFYQLQALRTSVNLFKAITKRNPINLVELATSEYSFEGESASHRYLEVPPTDKKGEIVDPFGHPYFYDSGTGWVRSSTSGYEFW